MLLATLQAFFHQHQFDLAKTCWVAYSGGLDSRVLLHLCQQLRAHFPLKLAAIHINHGLSQQATAWSLHCQQIAACYNVNYVERQINLQLDKGDSLEEKAREARYACFAEQMHPGDFLLTAHHQDDQAETVLLQLLRGSGLKGLAAMPKIAPFVHGFHGRPLLDFPRKILQHYAQEQQLIWINDDSNAVLQFSRNYLRHTVLPLLKDHWPSAVNTIARSARHCAEAQKLLEDFTATDYIECKGQYPHTLSIRQLILRSAEKQRLILRHWIAEQRYPMPNTKNLLRIQKEMLYAAPDRNPCVSWSNIQIKRYRDDLYLITALTTLSVNDKIYTWDFISPLQWPDLGLLHAITTQGQGISAKIKHIHVRFRTKGETVNLFGRPRHSLKKLLQEYNVPPWLRYRLPLLFIDHILIAIPGFFIAPQVVAKEGEEGHQVFWKAYKNNPSSSDSP